MDTSTLTFIAALVIAFLVIRHLSQGQDRTNQARGLDQTHGQAPPRRRALGYRRPVTQSMIEVVQALAPNLTVDQIRHDLERTGSVEQTVERFMTEGTLPFPAPKQSVAAPRANLIERYNVDLSQEPVVDEKPKWSESKEERQARLRKQQQDMVLRARKRLEKMDQTSQ